MLGVVEYLDSWVMETLLICLLLLRYTLRMKKLVDLHMLTVEKGTQWLLTVKGEYLFVETINSGNWDFQTLIKRLNGPYYKILGYQLNKWQQAPLTLSF